MLPTSLSGAEPPQEVALFFVRFRFHLASRHACRVLMMDLNRTFFRAFPGLLEDFEEVFPKLREDWLALILLHLGPETKENQGKGR